MRINSFRSLAGFIGLLALASTAWGFSYINNSQGQTVVWPAGSVTLHILVDSRTILSDGTTRATSIQTAAQTWNAQIATLQFATSLEGPGAGGQLNGRNEVFFASAPYNTTWGGGTLAVTVTWYTGAQAQESDVLFNSNYSWDSYRGDLQSTTYDIRRVALHELGHMLGLDHPDEHGQVVPAIMNSIISNLDALQIDDINGAQSLYGAPPAAPSITVQPANQSVFPTQSAHFSVVASGHPSPDFRWQRLPSGSGVWADLSEGAPYAGTSSANLTVTSTLAMNGDQFRCVASNSVSSATSSPATLTVTAATPPVITSQPSSQTVLEGATVTFTASASGVPSPALQWQRNNVDIPGATGASFTIAAVTDSDAGAYTMVATNLGGTATSTAAILTVNSRPVITDQSSTRLVLLPGDSGNLSVTATSDTGSLTYQWVHNGQTVNGATAATLSLVNVTYADSGWYLVLATNSHGVRRSSPFFVTVAPTSTEVRAWGGNGYGELGVPASLSDAIAVSAGGVHGLALKRDGTVVTWGDNGHHQRDVPGGLSNVAAVAAGSGSLYSLALKADGTLVQWGDYIPAPPAGLSGIVAIAGGENHAMALKSDGTVITWGSISPTPAGLNNVAAITAGQDYCAALKGDGTVVVWSSYAGPVTVVPSGLSGVVAIAAGQRHLVALKGDGTVVAWGDDSYGEHTTVVPAGLSGVTAISAASFHSLALKSDGTVSGWGSNESGESTVPTGLGNVFAVSAGTWFSVALRDAGADALPVITTQPVSVTRLVEESVTFTVAATSSSQLSYQWRKGAVNISGATGTSLTLTNLATTDSGNYDVVVTNRIGAVTSATAVLTVNTRPIITITAPTRQVLIPGQTLNLSVSATGTGTLGYQWIHNGLPISGATSSTFTLPNTAVRDGGWYLAQVTDNYGLTRSDPMFVAVAPLASAVRFWGIDWDGEANIPAGLTGTVAISASRNFSALALKRDGTVASWGYSYAFQLQVPAGLANVVAISAGNTHAAALKSDGTVVTWGGGGYGLLAVPAGLSHVVAVSAGGGFTAALKRDGTVVVWDTYGAYQTNVPAGLTNVIAIAAGEQHVLALKSDGTVVGWGSYDYGQLTAPAGLSGVVAISAGGIHSLALKNDGTVVAWGYALDGAISVPAGLNNVVAISGGQSHSLALKNDGTIVGWGTNDFGQSVEPAGLNNVWAISAGSRFSLALYDSASDTVPVITSQPASIVRAETQSVTLSVTALSAGPMTYQWRKNLAPISGATSASFSIASLALSDAGDYDVVITNGLGSTTSATAHLSVLAVPVITSLSAPRQLVDPGQSLNLSVTATGTGTLSYQWTHNGRAIPGATSSTFSLAHAGLQDNGYYIVYITDSLGTRRSPTIFVTVAQADGVVSVWGSTTYGQTKALPAGLNNIVAVAAGGCTALAIRADGTVTSWLAYAPDQTKSYFLDPTYYYPVPTGLTNVVAIAQGDFHSVALKADGTVVAWGLNTDGQSTVPAGLKDVVAIAATASHSLALKVDGTVVGWGTNPYGESTPPAGLSGVTGIATTANASLALKGDGSVVAWGFAFGGPTQVPSDLANVVTISSGAYFGAALLADGTVRCWGNSSNSSVPAGLNGVAAVSAGFTAAMAFKSDGTVVAWSDNTYDESFTPTAIPSSVVNIASMAAGRFFFVAACDSRSTASTSAPVFTVQPSDRAVTARNSVTFTAVASGNPAPTYQWRKNSVNIPGATGSSYTISGVVPNDAGNYTVVATNSAGTATSNAAVLSVAGALDIDFNADGSPDILLENTATGQRVLWLMGGPNNAYVTQGLDLGSLDPAWHIVGTADFNGDGKPDILLENVSSGQRVLWLMGGPNDAYVIQGLDLGSLDPVWHIVGTADFNGDGKPDILLENTGNGQRVLWLMGGPNNAHVTLGLDLGSLDPAWHIVGTADFNGDGKPDILLENTSSGQRVLWLMGGPNNAYVTQGLDLGSLDPAWHIVALADFNRDGSPDILLENVSSGQRVLWLMGGPNNAYVTQGLDLGSLDPVWHIVK